MDDVTDQFEARPVSSELKSSTDHIRKGADALILCVDSDNKPPGERHASNALAH
jgi:hypothetical protein